MSTQCQCECNNDMLQPLKLNTQKFAHEFRATTLECNAGQCEVKSILTLFHRRYIRCIKEFRKRTINNNELQLI